MFTDSPNKDYTGRTLTDIPASEFNGLTLRNYCFSQEVPDSEVFPSDMTGVTFQSCNLCNVHIPDGNTVDEHCSTLRFLVQNDLRDWILDDNDQPVRLTDEKCWVLREQSIDPADIPATFMRREVLLAADFEMDKKSEAFMSWFVKEPAIIETKVRDIGLDVTPERWEEMLATTDFYPFDAQPEAEKVVRVEVIVDGKQVIKQETVLIHLIGEATYVTIEGEGLFKGGIGLRAFENSPLTDVPKVEA